MAYRHLLELCPALESVITNDAMQCRDEDKTVVTGDAKAKHKSCQVVKIMTDPEDVVGCTAIIESIKAQWATADQEIFVAAIILNPFYQSTPFTALQFLTNAGIHSMLGCLWQH